VQSGVLRFGWHLTDKKTLKRINLLLKDIERNGNSSGIGKPEPLKHDYQGWWSRRIDEVNRVIYRIENDVLIILQCRSHYD
jgi:toxin YoeB